MRSFHSKIKLKSKKGSKITIANVYNPKHLKGGALNACPVFFKFKFYFNRAFNGQYTKVLKIFIKKKHKIELYIGLLQVQGMFHFLFLIIHCTDF